MDLGTGKTYATREDAIKAGVPESDIVSVRDTEYWLKRSKGSHNPHQSTRERERRVRQAQASK